MLSTFLKSIAASKADANWVSNLSQTSQEDSYGEERNIFRVGKVRVLPTIKKKQESTMTEEEYLTKFRDELKQKGADVDKALTGQLLPQYWVKICDPRLGPPQKQQVVMDRGPTKSGPKKYPKKKW